MLLLFILLHLTGITKGWPSCTSLTTCSSCMTTPTCAWCADTPYNNTRCQEREGMQCSLVIDNKEKITISSDLPLASRSPYVQIQPQAGSITLRPGSPTTVSFQVAQAVDYPVDLYFLMDLSWSMRSSRDTLANVGGDIIQAIRNRTKDLATGFGSFVEKNLPPFTSAVPEFNCPPEIQNCAPPYSFHHKAPLADISASEFQSAVSSSPLAGNVDDPEGSLDALMQVMVCESRIGWRSTSRRVLLVATDRDFHWAGDGRLAGVLTPNDGLCHLNYTQDGAGYYTMGQYLDYPSVSHISSVAQEGNFHLVFAVKDDYQSIYNALANEMPGRAQVAVLDKDGGNIINIVVGGFDSITTTIKVSSRTSVPDVGVKFYTDCGDGGDIRPGDECQNIPLGTPVKFTAEVNISSCLPSAETVTIFPVGMTQSLQLTLESPCSCECGPSIPSSPYCSNAGTLTCGLCQCDEDHYGERCQCSQISGGEGEGTCVPPGESSHPCSGRGECRCGVCHCHKNTLGRVYGSYCQCDDFSCPVSTLTGEMCGGKGECDCGECNCKMGWQGEACDCMVGEDKCISPYDGEVCSGHGECRCGECVCGPVGSSRNMYIGDFCQINPTGQGPCEELSDCVECQAFESGPLAESCLSSCQTFTLDYKESQQRETLSFQAGSTCTAQNNDGCSFTFSYRLNSTKSLWVVLHTNEGTLEQCPDLITPLSLGAGALVLLLGLLSILFYKCYIVIDDRRQYARFQSEAQLAKFGINQSGIYKSPITRTVNPMFGK